LYYDYITVSQCGSWHSSLHILRSPYSFISDIMIVQFFDYPWYYNFKKYNKKFLHLPKWEMYQFYIHKNPIIFTIDIIMLNLFYFINADLHEAARSVSEIYFCTKKKNCKKKKLKFMRRRLCCFLLFPMCIYLMNFSLPSLWQFLVEFLSLVQIL